MAAYVTSCPTGWCVGGELDADSSAQLTADLCELPEGWNGQLELDLGGVAFIDSSGLTALIALNDRVERVGGVVVIRNPSAPVRRLLAITKLDALFGVDGDAQG